MTSAACLLTVCFTATVAAAAQTTFKSRVESVRLDTLVTANGAPVLGLTADDFEVRDNGVIQKVTMIGAGSLPLDVILALDMSSSLTAARLDALKAAGGSLLDALERDDRAALATFSHVVRRREALTHEHRLVRWALEETRPSGDTSLIDGMYAAISMADAGDRRTLVIVFSDGIDTASWLDPAAVIRAAHRSETVVYAVSTAGPGQSQTLLKEVTTASGGRVFEVDSTDLASTFVQILSEFRQRYLLSYTLARAPSPGWHRVEVRLRRRGAVVRTRPGYSVPSR